jgi:hypothetical protein
MLHHASFNARNPDIAARVLAGMLNATLLRAPSPPFPRNSWFVSYGDAKGSYVEVLPWGHVHDPSAPFGVGHDSDMRPRSGAHMLLSSPRDKDAIISAASRAGWRAEVVDAGPFQVVKVWIENAILIEMLPPEMERAYLATFASAGMATLDAKLREVETAVSSQRSSA